MWGAGRLLSIILDLFAFGRSASLAGGGFADTSCATSSFGCAACWAGFFSGLFSDLIFDAGGEVGEGGSVAGHFVDGEDLAQGVSILIKCESTLKSVDGGLSLAETFPSFGERDVAGGDGIFEFDSLFESHSSFFIGAGFEVNQANIV